MFGVGPDAIDQVARHAGGETGAAHQHVTLRACCARNTAAWPAELPPPTSATSLPAHMLASSADAQYQMPRPSNSVSRGTAGRR